MASSLLIKVKNNTDFPIGCIYYQGSGYIDESFNIVSSLIASIETLPKREKYNLTSCKRERVILGLFDIFLSLGCCVEITKKNRDCYTEVLENRSYLLAEVVNSEEEKVISNLSKPSNYRGKMLFSANEMADYGSYALYTIEIDIGKKLVNLNNFFYDSQGSEKYLNDVRNKEGIFVNIKEFEENIFEMSFEKFQRFAKEIVDLYNHEEKGYKDIYSFIKYKGNFYAIRLGFNDEENKFLKFMEEIILDFLENDVYCNAYNSLEELDDKIFHYYEYDGKSLESYCYDSLQEDILYYFDTALDRLKDKGLIKEFILPDGNYVCYTDEDKITKKFY